MTPELTDRAKWVERTLDFVNRVPGFKTSECRAPKLSFRRAWARTKKKPHAFCPAARLSERLIAHWDVRSGLVTPSASRLKNRTETRCSTLVRTPRTRALQRPSPRVFREPARVPPSPAPAPHATMAPMSKAETTAANEDSNGAATELWRNTRVLGIILVYCAIGSLESWVRATVVVVVLVIGVMRFRETTD